MRLPVQGVWVFLVAAGVVLAGACGGNVVVDGSTGTGGAPGVVCTHVSPAGAGGCLPQGDPCTCDFDCCQGFCGCNGLCGVSTTQCLLDGTPCGCDSDCCSSSCDPTSALCVPPPGSQASCTTDEDCTSGNYCAAGLCSVCLAGGLPCSTGPDCCTSACVSGRCL